MRKNTKSRAVLVGASIGGALTPPAVLLALMSAGAGHGHYVLARLLFPYTMLLAAVTNHGISPPLIALALAQLPLYGVVIGWAGARGRAALATGILSMAHALAAGLCFTGRIWS